jgi:quaternary ammonium compound-resistance protein SugE
MSLAWGYLIIAGVLEAGWAIGIKYTDGFTRLWPSVLTIIAMIASVVLLGKAAQTLPIGTAYAVWVGVGAFAVAVLGIILFQEPATLLRLLFLGLLVVSIAGLKFTSH